MAKTSSLRRRTISPPPLPDPVAVLDLHFPYRVCSLDDFGIGERIHRVHTMVAEGHGAVQQCVEAIAVRRGVPTTVKERVIAFAPRHEPGDSGPLGRRMHWREAIQVIEVAVNDFIGACRGLARSRKRIAIVAKHIDWKLGPGPNPPTLAVVSVEVVKLARGRARDDCGLAVLPDGILGNPPVCGVNIEYRDIAAAACDISKRISVGELVGQLCRSLETNLLPAPDARLLCFADWKCCNP